MITRKDLERWADERAKLTYEPSYGSDWPKRSAQEAIDLLMPFLEFYYKVQADPARGLFADEMKLEHVLKKKLGMALKEWEKV